MKIVFTENFPLTTGSTLSIYSLGGKNAVFAILLLLPSLGRSASSLRNSYKKAVQEKAFEAFNIASTFW
jgi:hypothetical protein